MSQHVTAFLTLNLGVEMVYVIAQRLNAQNISHDRSAFVLNEIIAVLVSKELIMDIMEPQEAYSHATMRNIMENIAQPSIMRLDKTSMDKLWDLITMIFKWQVTLCSGILKITQRHVSELENYVSNGEILLQLRRVQNLVDNFGKILNKNQLMTLRDEILLWLKSCNVKVSLLLKMGLQNTDGSFVMNNDESIKDILQNLGQNIYSFPQSNKVVQIKRKESSESSNEVNLLVDQLLGEQRRNGGTPKRNHLKLNIGGGSRNAMKVNKQDSFQNIDIEQNDNK